MKIEEIATHRGMALTTIEGHLSQFIASGEIDIHEFLTKEDLDVIDAAGKELGFTTLSPLKQHFNDRFTFGQLRMAVAWLTRGS
jgi:ATP-dependent DNA helicase RecQ